MSKGEDDGNCNCYFWLFNWRGVRLLGWYDARTIPQAQEQIMKGFKTSRGYYKYECKEVTFLGGLESKFCLWLLRRHNRRVSVFLVNGSKGRNPTEWNRPLSEVIERHAVMVALYDRVCGEAQEKPWDEIDQGLKGNIGGPKVWKAYMTTALIGGLRDIVYQHRRDIE